jgi:hypothetical protein
MLEPTMAFAIVLGVIWLGGMIAVFFSVGREPKIPIAKYRGYESKASRRKLTGYFDGREG